MTYGTRTVRRRSTPDELARLDDAIVQIVAAEQPVTIRGVFYRTMSAGHVEKSELAYRKVQRRVLALRRSGRIPYRYISEGTRWTIRPSTWTSVEDALESTAIIYRRALWEDQPQRVEVWVEKDAITSVVAPVTRRWDVPLMVARGFPSETFLWNTAQDINEAGKPTVILNLGDHDPSGVGAWDQVRRKLQEFAPQVAFRFERLAVTEAQILGLGLPTRPTKQSDSRAKGFTGESVEVDAIPSATLRSLLDDAISSNVDQRSWSLLQEVETSERAVLRRMAGIEDDRW
ncbi:hypothetical protein SAMN05445060_3923 [Williamsia sterculiae]|uniref:DUF2399 domain-containing protein n=1 Tax=Williamsia sterculiae TaxID=1344003 RepID=A0A1N7HBZ4_9NOCA|nr:hypothetical protein SAMN05445060_3923 [Williamsia sterculiae]